ncbi:MAG: DsbA family protein [Pseudomonadota bacterium]
MVRLVGAALALTVFFFAGFGAHSVFFSEGRQPDTPSSEAAPPIALLETPGADRQSPSTTLGTMAQQDPQGARLLVRQALLSDPTILEAAVAALDEHRQQSEAAVTAQALEVSRDILLSADAASVLGNPDGSVTLVEFLDYNCSFCKRSHADVMRLIDENPDLRVLVREFPVLGPGSLEAARVAIAYRDQEGDMTAFIDAMMAETLRPADTELALDVVRSLGGDIAQVEASSDAETVLESISEAYALAEVLGIGGTPAFVVGNELLLGAVGFDRLSAAVQAARQQTGTVQ